jgi:hypothetical protein
MPPLPAVSKVVRVDFKHVGPGSAPAQFRRFFQYSGALSQADAQTWVAACRASWATNLAAAISSAWSLNLTLLTDLTSASAAQAQDGTIVAGTPSGVPVSNGTALVIKDKIPRRYRGGHPRTYLMGIPSTNLLNGDAWTSGFLGTGLTAWNAFIAGIISAAPAGVGTVTEVNVSYFLGFSNVTAPSGRAHARPTPRVTPLVDQVQSHALNPKPASQRRRNVQ